jgi:hypothetical protein
LNRAEEIKAIHTKVRGRARFKIKGLRHSDALKRPSAANPIKIYRYDPPNRYLLSAVGCSLAPQMIKYLIPGLGGVLGFARLGKTDFPAIMASALLPLGMRGISKNGKEIEKA